MTNVWPPLRLPQLLISKGLRLALVVALALGVLPIPQPAQAAARVTPVTVERAKAQAAYLLPPQVQFSAATFSVDEFAGPATITVTLSSVPTQTVTVHYTSRNNSAADCNDYSAVNGVLAFSPGQVSRTFSVAINNDAVAESDETVILSLSNPVGAVLGNPNPATLIIWDDDAPTFQFGASGFRVGESAGQAEVVVTLSDPQRQVVTVNYVTTDYTAVAGQDYLAAAGTLTFLPGQVTQTFTVDILDDPLFEDTELVTLTLNSPAPAFMGIDVPHPVLLKIYEESVTPSGDRVIFLNSSNYVVGESARQISAIATLSAPSTQTISVDYATGGGSATPGSDYIATSGVLTFAPGQTRQAFTVSVIDDASLEGDELIALLLSNPVGAVVGPLGNITIADDEQPVRFTLSKDSYTVIENSGPAVATVLLSGDYGQPVTVTYRTSPGTALAGQDYTSVNTTLSFAPCVLSQTFQVPIINDRIDELNEWLVLTLSDAQPAPWAAIGEPYTATLTILDDDVPVVQFDGAPFAVDEGAVTATVAVELDIMSTWQTLTVTYNTSNGTAVAPADYRSRSGRLVFYPGQVRHTFVVTVNEDLIDEPNENVWLALSSITGDAVITTSNPAQLIILDNDVPQVSFSGAPYTVTEPAGTALITATLNITAWQTVWVTYTTQDGSAVAPGDYLTSAGVLLFAPGVTRTNFSVSVVNDTEDEPAEIIWLNLLEARHAAITATNPMALTILDNDVPRVSFSQPDYSVNENQGSALITASLNIPSWQPVTVKYATSDGSALATADYLTSTGTLTFAPGQLNQTFSVTITDDLLDEPDETLTLTLSSPRNAALGAGNPATLTVVDDDVLMVHFDRSDYSVGEGDGVAPITVTLNGRHVQTVTVDYATASLPAGPGQTPATSGQDYMPVSGRLTFPPGQPSQVFIVSITDDASDEPDEALALVLSNASNATLAGTIQSNLTILDNDEPPGAHFSDAHYSASEAIGLAAISVTLDVLSGYTVTLNYLAADGTATAPADYLTRTGVVTFAPGQLVQSFDLPIINDAMDEGDETVVMTLTKAVHASLTTPNPATLTILDDDPLPVVRFDRSNYSRSEGDGSALITVTLNAESGLLVTVNYVSSDDLARAGRDYGAVSGTLTFTPGQTTQAFSLPLFQDSLDEDNETLQLALSNAANARIGGTNPVTLTIRDDDTPLVYFERASMSVDEAAGSAQVTVTLSITSWQAVRVDYATSNGTATAGADYAAGVSTLTFNPGQLTQTFGVALYQDTLDEDDETVWLTLSNPQNAALTSPNPAQLVIMDDDPMPLVYFDSSAYSVNEGSTAVIGVVLSPPSGRIVTLRFATADSTASAGRDYTAASGTLTFAPGQTTQAFDVATLDDALDEYTETVQLRLSQPSNAVLSGNNPVALTILDNDPQPVVGFSSAAYTVGEGDGTALVTVTLDAPSGITVTVNYTSGNGSALAGSDYSAASGRLTFAPGQTSRTFHVAILDDDAAEDDETVLLRLAGASQAVIGGINQATLTIVDDDMTKVYFERAAYQVRENQVTALITVSLSAPAWQVISVEYASHDGTARAGQDYVAVSGSLTFAPGQTSRVFNLTVINDTLYQTDRTVMLDLSQPVSAMLGSPNTTVLTILNDDPTYAFLPYVVKNYPPPLVQFSQPAFVAREDAGAALITVTLSASYPSPVSVRYASSDGTAWAGSDYTATAGSLTFAPGQTVQTFSLPLINDWINEPDETVTLTLGNPVNAWLGVPSTAQLTILDDGDPPPTVQFSAADYTVREDVGTAHITVTLSAPSGYAVEVNYAAYDDTALAGSDYTPLSGTLVFARGETVKTFDLAILDDAADELDETLRLALSDPLHATLGAPTQALVTIDDDDIPVVQFSAASYNVNENGKSATVVVTLKAPAWRAVSVEYVSRDGTARTGSDYSPASGRLTFEPGQTSQTFEIAIRDDGLSEISETVILSLTNPVNAVIGSPNPATLFIVDDDPMPSVQFSADAYRVDETANLVVVTLTLSTLSGRDVVVDYATGDGTAVAGLDYTAAQGTLTFAPGETIKVFGVFILDDTLDEPNEALTLNLPVVVGAQRGAPQQAILTIVDNDPIPDLVGSFSLSPNKSNFAAGEPVTITVVITNQGSSPASEFWVDFFINPSMPPSTANVVWSQVCGMSPCYGIAWDVKTGLEPGQVVTLTSTYGNYADRHTIWPGYFAAGTTDLFVYVDSWNPGVKEGAVAESYENNNRAERHGLVVTGPNPLSGNWLGAQDIPARPAVGGR